MKVFQILNDICYYRVPFDTLEVAQTRYAPDIVLAEAPNQVFEGWGYLDGQFIKPTPPEGWLYDDATGTFYQEGTEPPKPEYPVMTTEEATLDMLADIDYRLSLIELGGQEVKL